MERRAKVVKTLTGGVAGLFKKNKIDYLEGHGALTGAGSVRVGSSKDGDEIDVVQVHRAGHRLGQEADPRARSSASA